MPTLFKRSSGIYYISFEEEGRRKWKSTGKTRKSDALNELLTFEKLRRSYNPRTTLQAFIKDLLSYAQVTFSAKTVELYKLALRHLHSVVGNKLLTSITARDVDLYRTIRLKEVSPVTVNINLRSLRAAFSTAVRWKLLSENPFKKVSLVRVPDRQPVYFKKEDLHKLISIISEGWLRELVVVAVSTGLRRGELVNLTWKDLDFDRRLLQIQSTESFQTKAGRRRAVPMSDALYQFLWTKAQRFLGNYVFTLNGKRISCDWVTHKFGRYVRKAGLNPKLHFHSLRHTFATWLVQEGVSIYEVQKLLGHSNISVTQVYSHLAASELHGAVNKISVSLN